jgi:glyceraldehyde 3-phosphate dehydrogenase
MLRIGINGFGRMGRLAFRAGFHDPGLEFVQINEISTDSAGSAHLLQFDSVHGTWDVTCSGLKDALVANESTVLYSCFDEIAEGHWGNCDVVIEATGRHHKKPKALETYFEHGVSRVIVAAPTEGALNLVYGVNHDWYRPDQHRLLSAASCTTNCLAPLVKVMHEQIGIVHGSMTTIHNITNTQTIVDAGHKDLRRARACGQSLIPTTTGSARAITRIFPELEGRLNGHAVRVPLLNASLTDFVFEAKRPTNVDEVNRHLRRAAEGELTGILGYEERPLVSVDYLNDPRSSVVDALSTMVINDTQVKLYAWYDNEWGYANRLIDLVRMVARNG